jgi:hypothetical protein
MHDLVVREALETMAVDAAERLRQLIAAGAEIPYEVREPGDASPLCEYTPQTARFVRDHAGALRELDSFGAACAALDVADLAGPYLEAIGIDVPADPRRRAELAGVVFLARLWHRSTDFPVTADRLDPAIAEVEAGGELIEGEIEVVVPVRGLQMPIDRLDLATATLVRSDVVEVPAEARSSEGSGAAGWQPTFLAVARVGEAPQGEEAPDAGARAVEAFRQLVTTMRLFKPGGVGLGPHAWARTGGDRWRRIATGERRPRPGGYVLAEDELADLVALSRALAERSTPFGRPARDRGGLAGALARSTSRFEAGLERQAVLEALNDYLLALRFLLDGGGPADLGLSIRVAALCAEPDERAATKAVVERALALERELWMGEPSSTSDDELGPVETAAWIEELTRAILKDAACGHLGGDLRATADEILLADGLAIGDGSDGQRGATAEWSIPEAGEPEPDWASEAEAADGWAGDVLEPVLDEPATAEEEAALADGAPEAADEEPEPGKVPEPEGRIRIEQATLGELEEEKVTAYAQAARFELEAAPHESPTTALEAVEPRPRDVREDEPEVGRQDLAERVAYLFPRPEPCDWSVPEIGYDRRRRADVEVRAS